MVRGDGGREIRVLSLYLTKKRGMVSNERQILQPAWNNKGFKIKKTLTVIERLAEEMKKSYAFLRLNLSS